MNAGLPKNEGGKMATHPPRRSFLGRILAGWAVLAFGRFLPKRRRPSPGAHREAMFYTRGEDR